MKIGLLLPRSTVYASINVEILQGLRSFIQEYSLKDVELFIENIGFGTEKQQVYRSAEQLVLTHDVSVIFAYVGHDTAQIIRPLLAATNKLMIVLDPGAHLPHEWTNSEHIFYWSYHSAAGLSALAQQALRECAPEAAFLSDFYDGGYLHTLALSIGCTEGKGSIDLNLITGFKREEFSLQKISEWPKNDGNHAALCVFSMDYMQWFADEANLWMRASNTPLYLAPWALEEDNLSQIDIFSDKAKGIVSWSKNLKNHENEKFLKVITAKGQKATIFALMGWESGMLIEKIVESGTAENGREIAAFLKEIRFDTPRGESTFHKEWNVSLSPMYWVKVQANDEGKCALEIGDSVSIHSVVDRILEEPLNDVVSGWKNSYLCN